MVAVVTVNSLGDATTSTGGSVTVNTVLQGNPNHNIYPPSPPDLPRLLTVGHASAGTSYVIFTSFNRGGACLSAIFGYEPSTQVATFASQWTGLGPGGQIALPGRFATIPATIDLANLQAQLYPTGGVTYPADAGESFCPGP
jgi:hypothetical protein